MLRRNDTVPSACAVRLVYLSGSAADTDADVSRQLARLAKNLEVAKVDSVTAALDELRKPEGDFRALVISPALTEQDAIDAITWVRQDEPAVAILPVVQDRNQSSTFINAGASEFLLFTDGTLADPSETIARAAPTGQGAIAEPVSTVASATKKTSGLRSLFAAIRRGRSDLSEQEESDRQRLEARLNQIRDTAEQFERQHVKPPPPVEKPAAGAPGAEAPKAQGQPTARKRRATDTFTRAEFDAALNTTKQELAKVVEEQKYERAAWERTFHALQSQLTDLKTEYESQASRQDAGPGESGAATSEQQRAEFDETLAAERAAAAETEAKLEAELAEVRTEQQKTAETLASERTAWNMNRQQLEAALRHAQAELKQTIGKQAEAAGRPRASNDSAGTQAALEKALTAAQAEKQRALEANVAERAEWNAIRQRLEASVAAAHAELTQAASRQAADLAARTKDQRESAAERKKFETALAGAQAAQHKLKEAFAAERATWNETRKEFDASMQQARARLTDAEQRAAELDVRTKEAHESAAMRATQEAALTEAQIERQKTADAVAAERAAWTTTRRQLESALSASQADMKKAAGLYAAELASRTDALREAVEARTALEAALAESDGERHRINETLATERAAWNTAREELALAVRTSQSDLKQSAGTHTAELAAKTRELQEISVAHAALEMALQKTDAERRAAEQKRATDLAAWDAERKRFETRAAESTTAARGELDAAMATARAEIARITESYESERTSWQTARQQLEARVHELESAADARDKLEAALSATRTELQETIDIHAAERAIWEASRQLRETSPDGTTASSGRGAGREDGDDASATDPELLDAYRALEARLRETTNRLHLVRRAPGHDSGEASDERGRARGVEEVARLAMAIAPDITDLVSSIEEFGTQLSQELGPATAEQSRAAAILKRSQEAGDLLRQLLAFIEKQSQPIVAMDLTEAVQKSEHMLAWLVGAHIDFRTVLGPAAVVNVQSDDFQRLLTALVSTARDLLTAGGSVVVETAMRRMSDRPDQFPGGSKGTFPVLTVTASGYGVRRARSSPALDLVVRECGGFVSMGTSANGGCTLEVVFGLPQHAAEVNRRNDSDALPLQSAG